jgi:hypothetical protein
MVFPVRKMFFLEAVALDICWAMILVGEGRIICTQFSMGFPSSWRRIS